VLNSVGPQAGALFANLLNEKSWVASASASPGSDSARSFLRQLVTMIGTRNERAEINQVLEALAALQSSRLACALGSALGQGVQRAGSSLWRSGDEQRLEILLRSARGLLQDATVPEEARLAAVQLLGQSRFTVARAVLQAMLEPGQVPALQKASLSVLATFPDLQAGEDLLAAWDGLTPPLRSQVVEVLLRRLERIELLLSALEAGQFRPLDLSASQVEYLRRRPEPAVRERAAKLLGQLPVGARPEVVKAFSKALALTGNAEHGRTIYTERCSSCHKLAGQGHALGPDLESVRTNGKETLLGNILDPNREVAPKYVNYLAETRDGESVTGLIAAETDASVVLRQPNNGETILLRSNMQRLRSLGQSAMPEGLEEGLKPSDLADLMDYILTAKPQP